MTKTYLCALESLKCCLRRQILVNLVNFGDPKNKSRNPKKGRDPQFENRWLNVITLG